MASERTLFQIIKKCIPIAVIILFWTILSWFAWRPIIATGVRSTGLVIAVLYAIAQGVDLEQTQPHPTDIGGLFIINIRILLVTGPWFLAAVVVYVIWEGLGLPETFEPADSFVFVFTATGVITAVLYGVAVGYNHIYARQYRR